MPPDTIPSMCESRQTIADNKSKSLNNKSQLITITSKEIPTRILYINVLPLLKMEFTPLPIIYLIRIGLHYKYIA